MLTAYSLISKDEHIGSFSLPRVAKHYLQKYTSHFPFLFLLRPVRQQLFSSLAKLFRCGNIQYALVPENGNQFLYEFQLTRETLEVPYTSTLLRKKKKRLLKVLFNLAIASKWLLGEVHPDAPHSPRNPNAEDSQFEAVMMSYIHFISFDDNILSKKSTIN